MKTLQIGLNLSKNCSKTEVFRQLVPIISGDCRWGKLTRPYYYFTIVKTKNMTSQKKIKRLKAKRKIKRLIRILIKTETLYASYYDLSHASDALVSIGDEKVRILLLELLESQNARHLKVAAKTMARLKEKRAIEPLANHLASDNNKVREYCIRAIFDIDPEESIKYLLFMLVNNDEFTDDYDIAKSFISLISKNDFETLIPYLQNENAYTVAKIIEIIREDYNVNAALIKIGNSEFIHKLTLELNTLGITKKVTIINALSVFKEKVSGEIILKAIKTNTTNDDVLENRFIIDVILSWKEKPEIQNYLLGLFTDTKDISLAQQLLDSQIPGAKTAIQKAGFKICERDYPEGWGGWDPCYYISDNNGNQIS